MPRAQRRADCNRSSAWFPQDRDWLHHQLALRFEDDAGSGFVTEVRRLRERGDLSLQLPSMRCVGYRQIWEALEDKHLGVRTTTASPSRSTNAVWRPPANWPSVRITWLRSAARAHRALRRRQPVAELLAGLHRLLV